MDYQKFYEGKFLDRKTFRFRRDTLVHRLFNTISLSYSRRRSMFLQKHLHGTDNEILDFGCGGGTELFNDYGRVVGIDLSQASIDRAREIYAEAYVQDANELPFEDNRFDYIVSIDVFGHIPHDQKDRVLAEFMRVLKPGGKAVFACIETDGKGYFTNWVKQDEELYYEVFVVKHGHFGYEYPSEVVQRWRQAGFEILAARKVSGTLLADPKNYYTWFHKSPYAKRFPLFLVLSTVTRAAYVFDRVVLRGRKIMYEGLAFLYGLIDMVFAEHTTSIDYTRSIALVARKPAK